jgi:hypothetical protein
MSEMELQTGAFAPVIPWWLCAVAMSCVLITGCGGVQAGGEQSIKSTDQSDAESTLNYQYEQWRWRNGDIVYAYNGHADHMGMIDNGISAADNSPDVIDANTSGAIRRHNDFDKWADQGEWKNIEGYYVRAPEHAFDWEQMALDASENMAQRESRNKFNIGAVYSAQGEIDHAHSLFQRNSPDNTHSSQLIWSVYKYLYKMDLDSDGGWWIWPKDIREHSDVKSIPGALFTVP